LVENRRFKPTPTLFGATVGVTLSEFRRDLWRQKTRVHGLSYDDIVCVILCLAFWYSAGLWQKDGQTDRRTHDDSVYRASRASRGKNLQV